MNLRRVIYCGLKRHLYGSNIRNYSSEHKNPITKTWDVISSDVPSLFGNKKARIYPEHVDIVIIGGGFIGSSVAYSLKTRTGEGLSVVVLEKDMQYKDAQSSLSLGTLTKHFSLPENLYLSQYSADFFRNIKNNLGSDVDIQYQPCGNLVLACEKYAQTMELNVNIQAELGFKSELLTSNELSQRYPWLANHDIKLGCAGHEGEGLFNSWELLKGLINKSQQLGATYINAEVIGFEMVKQRDVLMEGVEPGSFEKISKVVYRTPDNEQHSIKFAACILAAGDNSGNIARKANIGVGDGLLSVPLPIEKRDYKIYSIGNLANKTGLNTPLVTDTSGLWVQRNKLDSDLLCGHIPLETEETKTLSNEEYFLKVVKPSLINRIPISENAEIKEISNAVQDCNTYDYSGILGPHPYHNNLYIAAGFGKQGCAHAPGIGRAIAELIVDSQFVNIDLTRLYFDRLFTNQTLVEFNIY